MSALDSLFAGPAQPALPALSQAAALAADEQELWRPALGSPPCIENWARGMFAVQQQMRQPSCPMTSSFFTKADSSSGCLSGGLPQEDWHGGTGSRVPQKRSSQGLSVGDPAAASQPTDLSPSAGLEALCSSGPSRIKVAQALGDQEGAELPAQGSAPIMGRGLGGHQEVESNSSAWRRLRLSLRQGGSVHHTSRLQCGTEFAASVDDDEGGPTGSDNLLVEAGAAAATAASQPFKTPWLSDCRQGALGDDAPGQLIEAAATVDSSELALPHLPSMSLSPAGSDVALDNPKSPACAPSGMLQQLHMRRGEASCGMFEVFRCKSTTPPRGSSGRRDTGQLLQSRGTAAEGVVDVFGMMNRQQLQHRRPGLARLSSSRGTCR
eukprot:gene2366-2671_t